jgi:hypothetical protein
MNAFLRAKKACCGKPSPSLLFKRYRKSSVPEGGWDESNFQSPEGDKLLNDISNVIMMAKLRGIRSLNEILSSVMETQVLEVIDQANAIYGRSFSTATEVARESGPSKEYLLALWLLAIDQVMQAGSVQVALVATPVIQSIVDDIYRKTMELLGASPNKVQVTLMTNRARSIANSLSSITNTTTERMQSTVEGAIKAGAGLLGVIAAVKGRLNVISTNRVSTILRTEIGRAADEAVLSAYGDSKAVSHVSVVGCQAIEPGIPTYSGVPTCNIQNVPVSAARRLAFHPNHTGIIIPSAFYSRNGLPPKLVVSRGRT